MNVRDLLGGAAPTSRGGACALAFLLACCTLTAVALPAAARAEACPNEALRQGASAHLPDCRAYEMVSPEFKGGYGVGGIKGVNPSGEGVAFGGVGVFAGDPVDTVGNDYEAVRSGSGWSTVSLMPPASVSPFPFLAGFSPSLGSSLWRLTLGEPSQKGAEGAASESQFVVHGSGAPDDEAGFLPVGPLLNAGVFGDRKLGEQGVSADLCHVIVNSGGPLLPEAVGAAEQLYDVSTGCGGEPPGVRLVALDDSGGLLSPACGPEFGSTANISDFNAVSADGSEVFFDANKASCFPRQVFVRVGGERTLEVSKPLAECAGGEVPCAGAVSRAGAVFTGASEDGSRVFFTTSAQLVPGDTDASNNLYLATIGCPAGHEGCSASEKDVTSMTRASAPADPGEPAEVQGVVRVAPDGSRVYFVARGVLGESVNPQGVAPLKGADNLYVYDVSGETAFIGDLCSGPELSGVARDAACPNDLTDVLGIEERNDLALWSEPHPLSQTAGAGEFLVFSSYARLIGSGPEADADDAQDVYRYDASSASLERISLGEGGYDANGNRNDGAVVGEENLRGGDARIQRSRGGFAGEEHVVVTRAVSEDGSRIVFSTAEPLSVSATNGLVDVYEWHEGIVSLISSGSSLTADEDPVITPSGRDVFFTTSAELVAGDSDGEADIYDARSEGGFPLAPAPQEPCFGDACQGALTNPAPLLVPGSVSQAAGGNFAVPVPVPVTATVKAKAKVPKCENGRVRKRSKCVGTKGKKKAKAGKAGNKRRAK